MPLLQKLRPKPNVKPSHSFKTLSKKAVLAIAIFAIGILVGQGRISFSSVGLGGQRSLNKQLPANLNYSDVEEVYNALRDNYDGKLDRDKLLDGLKQGLAKASGDPYTEYLNTKDAKGFDNDLNGSFIGIGAELGKNAEDNIVVVSPLAGFPAEKAGLRPKDVIVEIDGKGARDLSISEAVSKIRGEKDTKVKLKIIRGGKEELNFEIIRQEITIPSVDSQELASGIGYLRISRFGDDTNQLARQAADKFKSDNIKAVILDLRGDPGGLLDAAVDVSSLWLNDKTVLTERRGGEVIKTYTSHGNAAFAGLLTAVLINEGSASASEITAGALRDNQTATLIGQKSFGKGSVQQLVRLKDGSVLKVTVARWYTPSGKNIDKEGITPDKKVDRTEDDYKNDRDPQKDAAIEFLKTKIQ